MVYAGERGRLYTEVDLAKADMLRPIRRRKDAQKFFCTNVPSKKYRGKSVTITIWPK